MDNTLSSLIEKYGSDKNISEYSELYNYVFETNGKEKINSFLEIGVGTLEPHIPSSFIGNLNYFPEYKPGNSLRAYREFFPNAQIYGVDVAEDCRMEEDRLKTFIFDSTDLQLCNTNLGSNSFDIIIDDGLHTAHGQLQTLKNLFNRVRYDGFYVIEDLGGGGDSMNMFVELREEAEKIIGEHEYYFRSNVLIIKKSYSQKRELRDPSEFFIQATKTDLTIVTGLWDIGRPGRSFDHYMASFEQLLKVKQNLFIFAPKELESFIWERRQRHNTRIQLFELSDIKNFYGTFWEPTQKIRTSKEWLDQAGWLAQSPQGSLEWYNPIVMSKMGMLHDATIHNSFDTNNFIWLDGGITNTINYKLLEETDFFDKLVKYLDPFLFVQYPYPYYGKGVGEIHGYNWEELNSTAGGVVEWVSRGGLFGGNREAIKEANSYYWHLINDSLNNGLMGTEESLFSILAFKYPELFRSTRVNINGHIQEFVQKVIDGTAELEPIPEERIAYQKKNVDVSKLKVSIYMLTFNFPHQVEHTIKTWLKHPKFITNTRNILIDNSTNEEARQENKLLCDKYGFEHIITNENTGINGGRFRAAQHFQESDSDYYLFLEDDMGVNPPEETGFCRNGFRLYVDNLYDKLLKVLVSSEVDFLKLSFTEVYMDNHLQVSWYNVPQSVRTEFWPDYDKLPIHGLDPNCPRTSFDKIEFIDGLGYITGDIYYANWPTICGKAGNQKMFLDTTWNRPYEQTWMSYMFQETKKGNLKPAVLLASPILHNRIAHYKPEERREN